MPKPLLPDRHPTRDFFIANIFDSLPFKDDMASMEHPFFSLSTKKDLRDLHYTNGQASITIKPNSDGLPTIFDKDVLLYCSSLIMNEINQGRPPTKTLRVSTHDLLISTNRMTNGNGYANLKKSLDRLQGVSIKTNIKTNNCEITEAFGIFDSYRIVESSRIKDRMVKLEITVSDWFFNSLIGKEVLTINRDYFRLRKSLERRLYEIARKYCGHNSKWKIGLEKLKLKTGSMSSLRKFRFFIKEQSKFNHLPDYEINLDDKDIITFSQRKSSKQILLFDEMPSLKPSTLARGADLVQQAETGWDYNNLREQFTEQLINGFKPDNVNGAFINFIKNKIRNKP